MRILEKAPDFCLPDMNGNNHCLKDYRGKIVVINFWSAECPQSERVDGELAGYLESRGRQVVVLRIASNINESHEQVRLAAVERGASPVLWDAHQKTADLYAAQTTPHCFLVDRDGLLRYQGAFDDVSFRQRTARQDYLKAALEALLEGREPEPTQTQPYGCMIVRHLPDSC
ncbi:MAG: hypothetical protein A2X25_09000 [Chloroflexi bacterium GWB2_49_20]|nr:MAG: hypothetical protein A2X25_09000 [Chloroflexi bacterium GWB2_49_20]OGN79430.1 MAG: hypothetical protein A2X26_05025 [Chloroflexi bacterium GWC2_49_37]OGN82801.1 MAG: hypothetical protein A2X27_07670 [Chloroflexi bacterium GWD2_49_16]HCC79701.1 hypothetical protein [Anaerolineae bacterium]HCM97273.1 hypothetical protein [Anaerolineae bacterium]